MVSKLSVRPETVERLRESFATACKLPIRSVAIVQAALYRDPKTLQRRVNSGYSEEVR